MREARQTARHLAEGWAIEVAQQRKLITEYRDHLAWMAGELRALQGGVGVEEHSCPTCEKAIAGAATPAPRASPEKQAQPGTRGTPTTPVTPATPSS
jgi:hypothetical protein